MFLLSNPTSKVIAISTMTIMETGSAVHLLIRKKWQNAELIINKFMIEY